MNISRKLSWKNIVTEKQLTGSRVLILNGMEVLGCSGSVGKDSAVIFRHLLV
jgi:hypothetical protein